MYNLNESQVKSVEDWIKSLPDSIVKGNYERWLDSLNPKERITSEQAEKFISYTNALPTEFQNYPQGFVASIKNEIMPDAVNSKEVKKESAKDKAKASEKSQVKSKK